MNYKLTKKYIVLLEAPDKNILNGIKIWLSKRLQDNGFVADNCMPIITTNIEANITRYRFPEGMTSKDVERVEIL